MRLRSRSRRSPPPRRARERGAGRSADALLPDASIPREPKLLAHRLRDNPRTRRSDRSLACERESVGRRSTPRRGASRALPPADLPAAPSQRRARAGGRAPPIRRRARSGRSSRPARRCAGSRGVPKARKIRTKRPLPVGVLLRHYRGAERRFRVLWSFAAVNFAESAFERSARTAPPARRSDAVHARDVAGVRARRQRAQRPRRDHGRRQLSPRLRCAALHAPCASRTTTRTRTSTRSSVMQS